MFLWMFYTGGAPDISGPKPPNATITSNAPQTEIAAANATSKAAQIEAANSASTLQASNQRNTEVAFPERAIATELAAAKATSKAAQIEAENSVSTLQARNQTNTEVAFAERAIATEIAVAKATSKAAKTQAAIAVNTLSAANSRSTESAATQRSEQATRNAPTKRPIFVLPSSTPRVPDNIFPPTAPARIDPNSLIWKIIDSCNDGLNIWFLFRNPDRTHKWPANDSWATRNYGNPVRQAISCNAGTRVCYGAQPGIAFSDYYWGTGLDGRQSCKDCCYLCDGSTVELDLTCSE